MLNHLKHPPCPHGGWCGLTGDETGPSLCEGFNGCNYYLPTEDPFIHGFLCNVLRSRGWGIPDEPAFSFQTGISSFIVKGPYDSKYQEFPLLHSEQKAIEVLLRSQTDAG